MQQTQYSNIRNEPMSFMDLQEKSEEIPDCSRPQEVSSEMQNIQNSSQLEHQNDQSSQKSFERDLDNKSMEAENLKIPKIGRNRPGTHSYTQKRNKAPEIKEENQELVGKKISPNAGIIGFQTGADSIKRNAEFFQSQDNIKCPDSSNANKRFSPSGKSTTHDTRTVQSAQIGALKYAGNSLNYGSSKELRDVRMDTNGSNKEHKKKDK